MNPPTRLGEVSESDGTGGASGANLDLTLARATNLHGGGFATIATTKDVLAIL